MKDAFFVRMAECNKKKLEDEELKEIITGAKVTVHEKYGPVFEVKSFTRFFIDTNNPDAVPDGHSERRYFNIKCNEEKIGCIDDYFVPLHKAQEDDRVIRALYDFLKARTIKPTYHGKDIPVGEYSRTLKDSKRSEVEQFLEWLVEREDLDVETLHLTADEFAKRYKLFKGEGEERGTSGIMRQLKLQCIPGVEQDRKRPKDLRWCGAPGNKCSFCIASTLSHMDLNKVMRQYVVDCKSLRARYNIEEAAGPRAAPVEQPVAAIDCKAEVERFWRGCCDSVMAEQQSPEESPHATRDDPSGDHHDPEEPVQEGVGVPHTEDGAASDEGAAPAVDQDEEDNDDIGLAHARDDTVPSPNPQNDGAHPGHEEAAQTAAAPAAASPSTQGATTTPIVVPGVSAGYGAHGIPQTQEAIAQARAERQQRQQVNGKQRRTAASVVGGPAKKPRHVAPATGPVASVALC